MAEIAHEAVLAAQGGRPVVIGTVIATPAALGGLMGRKLLVREDGSHLGTIGGAAIEAAVYADCLATLTQRPRPMVQTLYYRARGDSLERLESSESDCFEVMVEVVEAPVTLLIVGGGHIGLSLATIAAHVGFSVAVVDDRQLFANAERFPMADQVMAGDVTTHLQSFDINQTTYIVLVSRGHKVDEQALRAVVSSDARYVGMIGSRRRVSTVLRHLAEEGYPIDALERVFTPIGYDIGAETPEEIAVSIMAEIIAVRRGGSGRPMREHRPSIRGDGPS